MNNSWCEVLLWSSDRMTHPGPPQQGVPAGRLSLQMLMEAIPGEQGGHTAFHRSDGDTRIPPAPSSPFGNTDARRGNKVCTLRVHPYTAADTPESLRCRLGCMRDRGALWGYEGTRTPSTPTH